MFLLFAGANFIEYICFLLIKCIFIINRSIDCRLFCCFCFDCELNISYKFFEYFAHFCWCKCLLVQALQITTYSIRFDSKSLFRLIYFDIYSFLFIKVFLSIKKWFRFVSFFISFLFGRFIIVVKWVRLDYIGQYTVIESVFSEYRLFNTIQHLRVLYIEWIE